MKNPSLLVIQWAVHSCEIAKKRGIKIGSIVTLGTPFMGTKIHMLGLKKHVHDLAEDSHYCPEERQQSAYFVSVVD